MAGRRTFRILTYSQLSGIKVKAVIRPKYNLYIVLLAKEEKVLQDIIDKLMETGRCYGMEMNVEKTKVMRISGQSFPAKIMTDQKQLENGNLLNIWVAF